MVSVQLFQHPTLGSLTTYIDDDRNEYFKAHDICIVLRLSNPSSQVSRNVKSKWVFEFDDGHSMSGKALYVSEPGLYALIFRSKTEQALEFQDWIFSEVLPTIRRRGGYIQDHDRYVATATDEERSQLKLCLDVQTQTVEFARECLVFTDDVEDQLTNQELKTAFEQWLQKTGRRVEHPEQVIRYIRKKFDWELRPPEGKDQKLKLDGTWVRGLKGVTIAF